MSSIVAELLLLYECGRDSVSKLRMALWSFSTLTMISPPFPAAILPHRRGGDKTERSDRMSETTEKILNQMAEPEREKLLWYSERLAAAARVQGAARDSA